VLALRARARAHVTPRDGRAIRAYPGLERGWRGGCDGEGSKQRSEPRSPREHAMMIAFVMAVAGIAVLGTMNLVAAH